MKIFLQRYGVAIGGVLLIVFFILTRGFPFLENPIPLGYDPGLYKSMFLAYAQLGGLDQLALLPVRIQNMYEPLMGMLGALRLPVVGGRSDHFLTRGWVISALLPRLGIWLLAHQRSPRAGLFAAILGIFSFTHYQVFWRGYRKQGIGMFFTAVALWAMMKKQWRVLIPVLAGSILVNRAGAVLIIILLCCIGINAIINKKRSDLQGITRTGIVSVLLVVPIILPLRKPLFGSLIGPFFSAIDLPILGDVFQAGGTFLTTKERGIVGWVSMLLAFCGLFAFRTHHPKNRTPVHFTLIVLLLRVLGQGYFFQRMIGNLDMILLIYGGIALDWLRSKKYWRTTGLVLVALGAHCAIRSYRTLRVYRPLIETNEFAFLTKIGNTIASDAVIIVPGIDYSPRVQGWTQRDVIAPGLFDLNRRGNLDEQWTTHRLSATPQAKCDAFRRDYPELLGRSIYLRIGSKQPQTPIDNACFSLLDAGLGWSRWKMR